MVEKMLCDFHKYKGLYEFIAEQPRTREDVTQYAMDVLGKKSKTTGRSYANRAFNGELPALVVKEDKVYIDEDCYLDFIRKHSASLKVDTRKLHPEPPPKKKKPEDEIAKVMTGESPIMKEKLHRIRELEQELAQTKAACEQQIIEKEAEWQKTVEIWQKKLDAVKGRRAKKASADILEEMDRKVFVPASIHSKPPEALARDFFLDDSHWQIDVPYQISKYGGEKDSLYKVIDSEAKPLEVKSYVSDVFTRLMKCPIFKRRAEDESHMEVVEEGTVSEEKARYLERREISGAEIYENRLRSINNMLSNPNLTNQMKLAYYAAMTEYSGKEMSDLLNYAGDECIDVAEVIRLLENPMEFHNYHNVRGYLRQAKKPSEAKIKRETVKELISGEWIVEAEYNGKMCRFQMLPVEELIAFRKALVDAKYEEAIISLQGLIDAERKAEFELEDAEKKLIVTDKVEKSDEQKYTDATAYMRQIEEASGVDVHVHIDEEMEDNFKEAKADGREK